MVDETVALTNSVREVDPSELISGELSVLLLEDSNDVMLIEGTVKEFTPTSKKRGDFNKDMSLEDLESANTKACLKEVKIEKIGKTRGIA
ncbi:unnamed protein product [Microthlaspi erraticum]|uniref:Uncharacterized protein n=1 Tax=Microthlaspi erraticum TaxID=1685480 RepID=A0A6D2HTU0_9BRAS|nr:unnamed protein product [Microthlaspi erraticum]